MKKSFKIELFDERAEEKFYERLGYFHDVEDVLYVLEKEGRISNPKFVSTENYFGDERIVYASMSSCNYGEADFLIYIYEIDPRYEKI